MGFFPESEAELARQITHALSDESFDPLDEVHERAPEDCHYFSDLESQPERMELRLRDRVGAGSHARPVRPPGAGRGRGPAAGRETGGEPTRARTRGPSWSARTVPSAARFAAILRPSSRDSARASER